MTFQENVYKILVVEDNPGDFLLVEEYIEEYMPNAEITHVKKFKECLNKLDNKNYFFDIILLDLSLPDVTKEIITQKAGLISEITPVIILTGYTDLDFATNSLSLGFSDYLIKDTINALILYKSILYALERHRFVQSLRESEKRYVNLFHSSPAPMWVSDAKTKGFLDVNKATIKHYGYTKEEFLEMTESDIKPKDNLLFKKLKIKPAIRNNLLTIEPICHQKKDKSIIFVEIIKNSIHFKDKKAEIVIATDVTERTFHLKEIDQQNSRLREIAWTQSHVVRAPVARLLGLVDLLKTNMIKDSEREKVLELLYASASDIDNITKDIVEKSQVVLKSDLPNYPETKK
ncbi:MAG: PAS domain S-box protein [Chitinophagaceae bacterium]|nr:MAG: PAS domain S-box protein [Chitinophagaceae bacterium]